MSMRFSDEEISRMLEVAKVLPPDYQERLARAGKLEVEGPDDKTYSLIVRQNRHYPDDFSVILGVRLQDGGALFRLRGYNAKSHEHTNRIEGRKFYEFHIHTATERYQAGGHDEDSFAEPTDRFNDLSSALESLVNDCGFVIGREDEL